MKYLLLLLSLFSFLPFVKSQCTHTFSGIDSYGDGWNGASVEISVNGVSQGTLAATGYGSDLTFSADDCDIITLNWTSGSYDGEISWSISSTGSGGVYADGVYGTASTSGNCGSASPTTSTSYCTWNTGSGYTTTMGMDRVVFGTIDNTTAGGNLTNYSSACGGSTTVTPGETVTLGVDILYYSEYIAFAADWNRNGVYDANELVDLGYQTTYYADYSIQVPVDAVPGNTSFRVACSYGNIAGQVCSDFASWQYGGEAEEYGLTISAPPSNPPVADFSANNTNPGMSEVVTFTDLSTEAPSSHSWSFSPSTVTFFNSTTSSSANPQVRFNAPGTYTVTLNATNNSGSDDEIKVDYITVADGYHIPNDGSIVSAVATCSGNVYDFGGASSSGSGGSGGREYLSNRCQHSYKYFWFD